MQSTIVKIVCDRCSDWEYSEPDQTDDDIHIYFHDMGWVLAGGEDICPKCVSD